MDNSYIGKTVDNRYEVISLIGVGGMSNVYKAIDRTTGNTVAIKFLKQEYFENEELVRRFKNESKAISLLDHPNIIKVIDVNIDSEKKYIVVEYIDGITLKDYIESRKVLSPQEAISFTRTILRAVGHAHDNGIIHRDLKPQNVMILRDGTLKLMDFGIARLSTASQKTMTDKAIGSVHYISPEQVRGRESDGRSDIYSIGIMLYEMLTGQLPFTGDTAMRVAMKQLNDRPVPPTDVNSDIPQGLEQITLKAMEKNPDNRYQSTQEMIDDIERFRKDPAIVFPYGIFEEEEEGGTQVLPVENMPKKTKTAKKAGIRGLFASLGTKKKTSRKPRSSGKSGETKKSDKKDSDLFPKWLRVLGAVARAVFFACMVGVFLVFKLSDNPLLTRRDDVATPNLVGLTEDQLKDAGYKFKYNKEYSYSSEYPEGVIFSQNPKPPQTIKENGTVRLKISQGPMSSQLKDLAGYSRSDAEEYLAGIDVNISITVQRSNTVAIGHVISTEPEKGTIIQSGDTVVLYVSSGDGSTNVTKMTVPNVVGIESLEQARKILAANSLSVGTYTYQVDAAPRGTILNQSPEAGTRLMAGQGVSLVISQGPPPPEPPKSKPPVSSDVSSDSDTSSTTPEDPSSSQEPSSDPTPPSSTPDPQPGSTDPGPGGEGGGENNGGEGGE